MSNLEVALISSLASILVTALLGWALKRIFKKNDDYQTEKREQETEWKDQVEEKIDDIVFNQKALRYALENMNTNDTLTGMSREFKKQYKTAVDNPHLLKF